MSRNLYDLIGLAAGICFILALKGLSSPKSARRGNLIGAVGATIATLVVSSTQMRVHRFHSITWDGSLAQLQ